MWKLNIPEVPIASLAVSPLRGAAAAALRGRQLLVLEPRQVGRGRAGRRLKHDMRLKFYSINSNLGSWGHVIYQSVGVYIV